jgi:hypothetical protein
MDNSGPAFPTSSSRDGPFGGLTKREYFAAHCPESEIPKLVVRDALDAFGLKRMEDCTNAHFQILRCRARYAWADAMIKENGQ